ncbi:hypothetical protein YC2023_093703 [Brassica napus]
MEAVSGGSRIYHTPTLGSVVNSIKWNHTNLVVARSEDDKNIYICGKKMSIVWEFKKMRIRINRERDVILKEMQERCERVYDPSEASIGWSVVTETMADKTRAANCWKEIYRSIHQISVSRLEYYRS